MVAKKQHFNILPDWSGAKIATRRVTIYNATKRTTPKSAMILLEVHLCFLVCFSFIIGPFFWVRDSTGYYGAGVSREAFCSY